MFLSYFRCAFFPQDRNTGLLKVIKIIDGKEQEIFKIERKSDFITFIQEFRKVFLYGLFHDSSVKNFTTRFILTIGDSCNSEEEINSVFDATFDCTKSNEEKEIAIKAFNDVKEKSGIEEEKEYLIKMIFDCWNDFFKNYISLMILDECFKFGKPFPKSFRGPILGERENDQDPQPQTNVDEIEKIGWESD